MVLAGCGSKAPSVTHSGTDDSVESTLTGASTGEAAPPTHPRATSTTSTPTTTPESQPGGGGDEETIRQPATFTLRADGRLSPRTVSVAPFLAVALTVRNQDSASHTVTLEGATVSPSAGGSATAKLAGLKAGRYPIRVDGTKAGSLVVGDQAVGP